MILAVLSDSHDNRTAIREALELARGRGATEILHCGDLTSPPMIALFAGWTLQYVSGNMDRDAGGIRAAVNRLGLGSSCGEELRLERDGLRITLLHGNRADRLATDIRSGEYDFVFHGHTHRPRDERVGRTRVINPGALGSVPADAYSFCVLDASTGEIELIKI
jgi:putative phosphoesterase